MVEVATRASAEVLVVWLGRLSEAGRRSLTNPLGAPADEAGPRYTASPRGEPATSGSSSPWADGTEPVISPRVHLNPDERLADLVDGKTGIAISAAGEDLGLTPTALAPLIARLVAVGRIVSRDPALHRPG